MIIIERREIELTEYERRELSEDALSHEEGMILWDNYGAKLEITPPSWQTQGKWVLKSLGWVGYIPLSPSVGFRLKPKVELGNLFRMLEYAYRIELEFLEDLIDCRTLEDFYERVANILARRVLDRGKKGFYRCYVPEFDHLPFIRGRLDVRQTVQQPWRVRLPCDYEDHTPDVVENQILSWTLSRIAGSGMCTEEVLPTVRRAYRSLRGLVSLQPFSPAACVGRLYNRLNDDYQPLHALCRFFLEHSGPSHEAGDHTIMPFLIDMNLLYEKFVAAWLAEHLPGCVTVRAQENVTIGQTGALSFNIDLVLYDVETRSPICVLDTKYKVPDKPASDDVLQVIGYAEMKNCRRAALIYPSALPATLDERVGNIRVQSLTFSLAGDLEAAGQAFLTSLTETGILPSPHSPLPCASDTGTEDPNSGGGI
jgi:5-methylcytosine-specific restriction enzyme subunit McrC